MSFSMEKPLNNNIVLFDGICNLCNESVQLIIRNDKKEVFSFSPLQSDFSKRILKDQKSSDRIPDSIVLIEENRLFFKSTAALKIAKRMDRPWPLFYLFIIIPKPVRDFFYDQISKHRYRVFGKKDSCMLPSAEINSRFL